MQAVPGTSVASHSVAVERHEPQSTGPIRAKRTLAGRIVHWFKPCPSAGLCIAFGGIFFLAWGWVLDARPVSGAGLIMMAVGGIGQVTYNVASVAEAERIDAAQPPAAAPVNAV